MSLVFLKLLKVPAVLAVCHVVAVSPVFMQQFQDPRPKASHDTPVRTEASVRPEDDTLSKASFSSPVKLQTVHTDQARSRDDFVERLGLEPDSKLLLMLNAGTNRSHNKEAAVQIAETAKTKQPGADVTIVVLVDDLELSRRSLTDPAQFDQFREIKEKGEKVGANVVPYVQRIANSELEGRFAVSKYDLPEFDVMVVPLQDGSLARRVKIGIEDGLSEGAIARGKSIHVVHHPEDLSVKERIGELSSLAFTATVRTLGQDIRDVLEQKGPIGALYKLAQQVKYRFLG